MWINNTRFLVTPSMLKVSHSRFLARFRNFPPLALFEELPLEKLHYPITGGFGWGSKVKQGIEVLRFAAFHGRYSLRARSQLTPFKIGVTIHSHSFKGIVDGSRSTGCDKGSTGPGVLPSWIIGLLNRPSPANGTMCKLRPKHSHMHASFIRAGRRYARIFVGTTMMWGSACSSPMLRLRTNRFLSALNCRHRLSKYLHKRAGRIRSLQLTSIFQLTHRSDNTRVS